MESKVYVTMTDTLMSGWGLAEGKMNKLVLECNSMEEAEVVAENARNRGDQRSISIRTTKPTYSSNRYLVSYGTKEEYRNWYQSV